MPVGMPRCLQAYLLLREQPTTSQMLAAKIGCHESTANAWLNALQTCELATPCATEHWGGKGGINRIVWKATED